MSKYYYLIFLLLLFFLSMYFTVIVVQIKNCVYLINYYKRAGNIQHKTFEILIIIIIIIHFIILILLSLLFYNIYKGKYTIKAIKDNFIIINIICLLYIITFIISGIISGYIINTLSISERDWKTNKESKQIYDIQIVFFVFSSILGTICAFVPNIISDNRDIQPYIIF